MSVGFVVARFQVPKLTAGHHELIKTALEYNDRVIVLLGVSPVKGSSDDPLDFETRRLMVQQAYKNVTVFPLPNQPSDEQWTAVLNARIAELCPFDTAKLYCGRDGFKPHYKGPHEVIEISLVPGLSGTEIRRTTGKQPLHSEDFRAGVIYGLENKYPTTYMTVDIALWGSGKVLMGRKPGFKGYTFPGGFVDKTDPSLEFAACRELYEETAFSAKAEDMKYVTSMEVDDYRYRGRRDCRIMTTLFAVKNHTRSDSEPMDREFLLFEWVNLLTLPIEEVEPCHRPLFEALRNY